MALQLAGLSTDLLARAVEQQDARTLSNLKGVGKKTAEKILVELKSLSEKGLLVASASGGSTVPAEVDDDALEALVNLGYDRRSILERLRETPEDIETTEERVKYVLQTL